MTPKSVRTDQETAAQSLEEATRLALTVASALGGVLYDLEEDSTRTASAHDLQPGLARARSVYAEMLAALAQVASLSPAAIKQGQSRPGLAAGVPERSARRVLLSGAKALTASGRLEGVFAEFRAGLGKWGEPSTQCAARIVCDPVDASVRLAVFRRSDNAFVAQSLPVRLMHLDSTSYLDTSDWSVSLTG